MSMFKILAAACFCSWGLVFSGFPIHAQTAKINVGYSAISKEVTGDASIRATVAHFQLINLPADLAPVLPTPVLK
ncbi:MAG: hypothetical protein ACREQW_11665 [Candidatus Binatia bacterium]